MANSGSGWKPSDIKPGGWFIIICLLAAIYWYGFSMNPLYSQLASRGYTTKDEHVVIFNTPVQFLPAHNDLAVEAVEQALTHDYDGVPMKVIGPEHLIALALQAGGSKRRIRVAALLEEADGEIDQDKLQSILTAYNLNLDARGGKHA